MITVRNRIILTSGLLLFFCYILYPVWLIPGGTFARLTCFLCLALYIPVVCFLLTILLPDSNNSAFMRSEKLSRVDWMLLASAAIMHVPLLFRPVRNECDESTHMGGGIQILDAARPMVSAYGIRPEQITVLAICATVLAGFCVYSFRKSIRARHLIIPGILLLIFLPVYFLALSEQAFHLYLFKPMPLSRFIFLPLTALTGASIPVLRLPSLVLYLAGAVFFYKTGCLFLSRPASSRALRFFLLLPPFFYFAAHGTLGSGTVFFCVLNLYFLCKAFKEHSESAMNAYALSLFVALLWKRALLMNVFIGVLAAVVFRFNRRHDTRLSMSAFKCTLAGLLSALPMLVIEKGFLGMGFTAEHIQRSADVAVSDILISVIMFIRYIPFELSGMIAMLGLAGILLSLRSRNRLRPYYVLFFGILLFWYVPNAVFSSFESLHERHLLPVHVPLLLFAAAGLEHFPRMFRNVLFSVTAFMLLICSTVYTFHHVNPRYMTYRPELSGDGYLPYCRAIDAITDLKLTPVVFALDMPDSREICTYKRDAEITWILARDNGPWACGNEPDADSFYAFCRRKQIDYLLLPEKKWIKPEKFCPFLSEKILSSDNRRFQCIDGFQQFNSRLFLFRIR